MLADGVVRATEWEDGVLFDDDDPDFTLPTDGHQLCSILFTVPSMMSAASIQTPLSEMCPPMSQKGRSHSVSSSLSDLCSPTFDMSNSSGGDYSYQSQSGGAAGHYEPVLTIEELRAQLGSCFTCGVSWSEQHVSLDCGECGGYAMQRPCPLCEGRCEGIWKRDLTMSHACSKARWEGRCGGGALQVFPRPQLPPASRPCAVSATSQLAQELCARLEKLSASS